MAELGSCEQSSSIWWTKDVDGGRKRDGDDVSFVRLDIIINTGLFNCDTAQAVTMCVGGWWLGRKQSPDKSNDKYWQCVAGQRSVCSMRINAAHAN